MMIIIIVHRSVFCVTVCSVICVLMRYGNKDVCVCVCVCEDVECTNVQINQSINQSIMRECLLPRFYLFTVL